MVDHRCGWSGVSDIRPNNQVLSLGTLAEWLTAQRWSLRAEWMEWPSDFCSSETPDYLYAVGMYQSCFQFSPYSVVWLFSCVKQITFLNLICHKHHSRKSLKLWSYMSWEILLDFFECVFPFPLCASLLPVHVSSLSVPLMCLVLLPPEDTALLLTS